MARKTKKRIKLLTREQMSKLSTKSLLAYLRRLHQVHAGPNWEGHEPRTPGKITKDTKEWKDTHRIAKEILKERDHVNE